MYTIYVVHERREYHNFPGNKRYDVGSFYVQTYTFDTLREVVKFGAGFSPDVIDEIVFFDRECALEYANDHTETKLSAVLEKLASEK